MTGRALSVLWCTLCNWSGCFHSFPGKTINISNNESFFYLFFILITIQIVAFSFCLKAQKSYLLDCLMTRDSRPILKWKVKLIENIGRRSQRETSLMAIIFLEHLKIKLLFQACTDLALVWFEDWHDVVTDDLPGW